MELTSPQFSPDGKRLVFQRTKPGRLLHGAPRPGVLHVVDVDGGDLRRLTPRRLRAAAGAQWSPDGSRILFWTTADYAAQGSPRYDPNADGGDLYTIRPDGTGLRRLTRFGQGIRWARFSTDGTAIVFDDFTGSGAFVIPADGAGASGRQSG